MSIIKWDDSYAVGVEAMDAQHRNLFSIINKFYAAVNANADVEKLTTIFKEVLDYTDIHFANEENLMQRQQFPDFEIHKSLHERLVKQAVELYGEISKGKPNAANDAIKFLRNWLEDHIRYTDVKYGHFINDKGAA